MRIEINHTEHEKVLVGEIKRLEKSIATLTARLEKMTITDSRCIAKEKALDAHIARFTQFYRENCEETHDDFSY